MANAPKNFPEGVQYFTLTLYGKTERCVFRVSQYAKEFSTGPVPAVEVLCWDNEFGFFDTYAKLSSMLEEGGNTAAHGCFAHIPAGTPMSEREFFLKEYSENEAIAHELINQGLIRKTGVRQGNPGWPHAVITEKGRRYILGLQA
jgi:hypothetical protein